MPVKSDGIGVVPMISMKIAQIAPLAEPVPPDRYGGTERVVASLTDELVRRGHEVTLFASGDSGTDAHLVAETSK
jgi:glycosyltransferase involved in cell wall biosynthesis